MSRVKDIVVKVIKPKPANNFVVKHHYSGRKVPASNLHFGAFLDGRLHGVVQLGTPFRKSAVVGLVKNTDWYGMTEINRMAFDEYLPRNSESRVLGIICRMLRKNAPQLKWLLSFADATQCGDGTIYRAAGFLLTQIKKNENIARLPNGEIRARVSMTKNKNIFKTKGKAILPAGSEFLKGYQLRYIKLLYPDLQLNCPNIPYSEIEKIGAGMYRGKKTNEHHGKK